MAELEDVTPSGTSYPLTEGALLGSLRAVDQSRSWTAAGMTLLPYHPYTEASARPVTPGTRHRVPDRDLPDARDDRRGRLGSGSLSRPADAPHLTPLPEQLPELAGGVYTIEHSGSAPSSLTLELLSPGAR